MYRAAGLSDEDDSDEGFSFGTSMPKATVVFQKRPEDPRTTIENELFRAVQQGDLCAIQKSLNNDVGVTLETPLYGNWTPIMHACSNVNIPVVKFLLQAGCSANAHIALFTPLMACCSTSHDSEENILALVKLLIVNGANVHLSDAHGTTALMLACQVGHISVVTELLAHRARVNDEDNQGRTALYWAVNENHYKICSLLIEKNCTIDMQDSRGLTPLQLASSKGYNEIVDLLESCTGGKKPNAHWFEVRALLGNLSWRKDIPGDFGCGIEEPPYYADVDMMLNGMELEYLATDLIHQRVTLSEFLCITEERLIDLGVKLPYQRRMILHHLELFHVKKWSKNSISRPKTGLDFDVFTFLQQVSSHYKHTLAIYCSLNVLNRNLKKQEKLFQDPKEKHILFEIYRALRTLRSSVESFRQLLGVSRDMLVKILNATEHPVDLIGPRTRSESKKDWRKGFLIALIPVTILCLKKFM